MWPRLLWRRMRSTMTVPSSQGIPGCWQRNKVLERHTYPSLNRWIDNLFGKIDHLVQLLTLSGDDLKRLPKWLGLPGGPQAAAGGTSVTGVDTKIGPAIGRTHSLWPGCPRRYRRYRLTLGKVCGWYKRLLGRHRPRPFLGGSSTWPFPIPCISRWNNPRLEPPNKRGVDV